MMVIKWRIVHISIIKSGAVVVVSSFFLFSSPLQSPSKNNCHQQHQRKKSKIENRDDEITCSNFRFEYVFVYKVDILFPIHQTSFLSCAPSSGCATDSMFDPASPSKASLVASASTFRLTIERVEGEEEEVDLDENSLGDLKEGSLMNSLRWRWSANDNPISMNMKINWVNPSIIPTVKKMVAVNAISISVTATLRSM